MQLLVNKLPNRVLRIFAGAAAIALGALLQFPIPGTEIPQTGQTIAVLSCGALLGCRQGSMAVVIYLLAGALGLPVFSDGASGWPVLTGSSAGYFGGFLLAAAALGTLSTWWMSERLSLQFLRLLLLMLAGHAIILACGWAWLTTSVGVGEAYRTGMAPFYYGALVKSLLTALLVSGIRFTRRRI